MEIKLIQQNDNLWNKTIEFADSCSWKAGHLLAEKMRKHDFLKWERVIIACDNGKVVGYCTITERDELPDAYGYSSFIGFLFVDENSRGCRISEQMINMASDYAQKLGYGKMYVTSGEHGLYEKYGFVYIGDYQTIYGTSDQLFEKELN